MKRWMIPIVAFAVVAAASAQQGTGREDGNRRGRGGAPAFRGDRGEDGFRGQRGERGRRGGPGRRGRGMPVNVLIERLANQLELTDAQRTEYDAIADRIRNEAGQRGDMRNLMEQMRQARESGDETRAAELRHEMRALGQQRRQMVGQFFDEVSVILDDTQLDRLTDIRTRLEQREDRMRDRRMMRDLMEDLPNELELSEDQVVQYEALREQMRAQRRAMREQWRELRPLMEELRAAHQAGDEQLAEELRAEFEARRPQPPGPEAFLNGLREILNSDQQAHLDEMIAELGPRAGQGRGFAQQGGKPADMRTIMRAVRRLDLTSDQQTQVKDIIREARRNRGDVSSDDASRFVQEEINKILTADQKSQFDRLLANEGRPQRGERRGDHDRRHGDRRGRGAQNRGAGLY